MAVDIQIAGGRVVLSNGVRQLAVNAVVDDLPVVREALAAVTASPFVIEGNWPLPSGAIPDQMMLCRSGLATVLDGWRPPLGAELARRQRGMRDGGATLFLAIQLFAAEEFGRWTIDDLQLLATTAFPEANGLTFAASLNAASRTCLVLVGLNGDAQP